MGNDRSPKSQHDGGDSSKADSVESRKFKWDHFHSISDENKTLSNISHKGKDGPV